MIFNDRVELLAPAGTVGALDAAVDAGADAVYFGAHSFNARMGADNFSDSELEASIHKCRILGVKTNITLNTQLYDRELTEALDTVGRLLEMGADAFIVADVGLARMIKARYPDAVLHASTQMSGQNIYSAEALRALGFSRMVAPRELSRDDMAYLCAHSPIETEVFIHGALCVSFSGQCLMSSVIGGRSGNRGECAQPCRLPYKCKCTYPLSLKDNCLASHMTELLNMGIASMKIEGRMKSPDYVYGVTSIYRTLIDEHRNATDAEIVRLGELFSRSGFTDGYYKGAIGHGMLGVRTDNDKCRTSAVEVPRYGKRTKSIDISANFTESGATFTASCDGVSVTSDAECSPEMRPVIPDRISSALSKSGGTPFTVGSVDLQNEDNCRMPISALNAARRALTDSLADKLAFVGEIRQEGGLGSEDRRKKTSVRSAYFEFFSSVTDGSLDYFDRIFVPTDEYVKNIDAIHSEKIGIAMPTMAFDSEIASLLADVKKAYDNGARLALATSVWQISGLKSLGFSVTADMRMNVYNSHSAAYYSALGCDVIASAEIGVAGAARLDGACVSAVIYGRLPLMTTQKCVIREIVGLPDSAGCNYCDKHSFTLLTDRTGAAFPVVRCRGHRNVIYNSVPVWMSDRSDQYTSSGLGTHYIFTTETAKEVDDVISSAVTGGQCRTKFKRL